MNHATLMQPERLYPGFKYHVEHIRRGRVIDEEEVSNLVPLEGLNYMLNVSYRGLAQSSVWSLGLYSGNYTPTSSVLASTLNAVANELLTYDAATRLLFTTVAATTGSLSNVGAPAEFISTLDALVYGGFMSTASAKGSGTGLLGSVVRFATAKQFNVGDTLRMTGGLTLIST